MKRLFMPLILFFILLNLVSAIQLGISPVELDFNGKVNEKICKDIVLTVQDYNGLLIGQDKWSKIKSRNSEEYNYSNKDFGIIIDYTKKFDAQSENNLEVCITAGKAGKFYGILFYSTENNSEIGIGNWINLNIDKQQAQSSFSLQKILIIIAIIISAITLIIVISLLFLLIKRRKSLKKRKKINL